jgi:hypothetical protein
MTAATTAPTPQSALKPPNLELLRHSSRCSEVEFDAYAHFRGREYVTAAGLF